MSDQFLAEIRIVGFNFAPTGWAECNGQILPLSQNTALFALLGTVYGGDGKSTFALPNMQGSTTIQPGQGQGLSLYDLGQMGGSPTVTLIESEMPVHAHTVQGGTLNSSTGNPSDAVSVSRGVGGNSYKNPQASLTQMAPQAISPTGGSAPHNNLMPYLVLKYVIALQGIFPQRP